MRLTDIMHMPVPDEPWFDLVDYCERFEMPVPVLSAMASWLLEELCECP